MENQRRGEVERESFVEELTRKPLHDDGVVKRRTRTRRRSLSLTHCVLLLLGVCCLVSLPWEFIRIYQIEVAKKAAITLKVHVDVINNDRFFSQCFCVHMVILC